MAVVGVGFSPPVRRGDPSINAMTRTAALAALGDAGLKPADLDAIIQYSFGIDSPNATSAQRLLGVPDLAVFNDIMGTGPSGLAGALDRHHGGRSGRMRDRPRLSDDHPGLPGTPAGWEGPAEARGSSAFTRTLRVRRRHHDVDAR